MPTLTSAARAALSWKHLITCRTDSGELTYTCAPRSGLCVNPPGRTSTQQAKRKSTARFRMDAEEPLSTEASKSSKGRRGHRLFELAILLKGVDGALELVGGVLAAFVPLSALDSLIYMVTAHELSLEPDDRIANALRSFADVLSIGTKHYAAAYLLSHGLLKLVLVYGLWREKTWAFPRGLPVPHSICRVPGLSLFPYRFALSASVCGDRRCGGVAHLAGIRATHASAGPPPMS